MENKYFTVVTDAGTAKMLEKLGKGEKLELAHFAAGDGGGAYCSPAVNATALKNEVWRGDVNACRMGGEKGLSLIVEAVIPSGEGGFTIREMGVFDGEGTLIAVCNTPETRKASLAEGVVHELHLSMELAMSNTDGVELVADPAVIMATKKDVEDARRELRLESEGISGRLDRYLGSDDGSPAFAEGMQAGNLVEAVNEVFTLGSERKARLAANLTAKNTEASADDTWDELLDKILDMTDTASDTVVAEALLSGYTAHDASGAAVTGTMPDNGAWTGATTGSGNVPIPAGYHDGSGYVSGAGAYSKGVSDADARVDEGSANYSGGYSAGYGAGVAAAKKGNAGAGDVLSGKTFTNASSVEASGTMPDRGAWTGATTGSGNVGIPAGYHNGSGHVSGAGAYNAGVAAAKKGNAGTGDVLSGKTFTNASSIEASGTMPNNGAWTSGTSDWGNVGIPAGYHNGNGYVSGAGAYNRGVSDADGRVNSASANYAGGYSKGVSDADNRVNGNSASYRQGVSDADGRVNGASANYAGGYNAGYGAGVSATKKGNAGTGDVLSGRTFTNAGSVEVSGTMPNYSYTTVNASGMSQDDSYMYLDIPAGYYGAGSKIRVAKGSFELTNAYLSAKYDFSNAVTPAAATITASKDGLFIAAAGNNASSANTKINGVSSPDGNKGRGHVAVVKQGDTLSVSGSSSRAGSYIPLK